MDHVIVLNDRHLKRILTSYLQLLSSLAHAFIARKWIVLNHDQCSGHQLERLWNFQRLVVYITIMNEWRLDNE